MGDVLDAQSMDLPREQANGNPFPYSPKAIFGSLANARKGTSVSCSTLSASGCEACALSSTCGWCASRKQCVEGSADGPSSSAACDLPLDEHAWISQDQGGGDTQLGTRASVGHNAAAWRSVFLWEPQHCDVAGHHQATAVGFIAAQKAAAQAQPALMSLLSPKVQEALVMPNVTSTANSKRSGTQMDGGTASNAATSESSGFSVSASASSAAARPAADPEAQLAAVIKKSAALQAKAERIKRGIADAQQMSEQANKAAAEGDAKAKEISNALKVKQDEAARKSESVQAVTKAAQTSLKTGNVYGETQKTTMEKGKAELSTIEASISEAKAEEVAAAQKKADADKVRADAQREAASLATELQSIQGQQATMIQSGKDLKAAVEAASASSSAA